MKSQKSKYQEKYEKNVKIVVEQVECKQNFSN